MRYDTINNMIAVGPAIVNNGLIEEGFIIQKDLLEQSGVPKSYFYNIAAKSGIVPAKRRGREFLYHKSDVKRLSDMYKSYNPSRKSGRLPKRHKFVSCDAEIVAKADNHRSVRDLTDVAFKYLEAGRIEASRKIYELAVKLQREGF